MANLDLDTVNDIDYALNIDCQTFNVLEDCKNFVTTVHNFKLLAFNIRSINKNFNEFLVAFQRLSLDIDVIILSECWLGSDPIIGQIPGYDSYTTKKIQNKCGGVVTYVKEYLNAVVNEIEIREAECIKIDIPNTLAIYGIYRSPSFRDSNIFCKSLGRILEKHKSVLPVIVTGDVNIDIMSPLDEDENEYICMMTELGLRPVITNITRDITGTCLDHIFIKGNPENIVGAVCNTEVTDHNIVLMGLSSKISSGKQHKNRYFIKTDYKAVALDLQKVNWDSVTKEEDLNVAVDKIEEILKSSIIKNSCKKRVSRSKFALKPWITPGLLRCMRHRDKLHLDLRNDPENVTKKKVYLRYRNFFNNLLSKLRQDFESKDIEANKHHPKKLWKSINTIIDNPSKKSQGTELLNCKSNLQDSRNYCNEYFTKVGPQLANELLSELNRTEKDLAAETDFVGSRFSSSFYFQPTDEFEVAKIINGLKKGSAPGLDGIKPDLIKEIIHEILSPLVHIINTSLQTGTFPQKWKVASVTPIHKAGQKTQPENYRPISLLPVLSKILEKVVNHRLVCYLEKYNLISDHQYGFRRGKSTEDAMELLSNRVSDSLDQGKKTIGVFLDLAKAFDTISVDILFKKLELFGIRGLPLKWFQSYLSQRSQCIKIGDSCSETLPIRFGVPQGSVLGPTLFILYINDIHTANTPETELICFADDTLALFHSRSWKEVFKKAEKGMINIKRWLDKNLLTLNLTKTKYLCFHKTKASEPKSQLILKVHSCDSSACNCIPISRAQSIKYLGVIIDERLTFKEHITLLSKRVRKLIHVMKALRSCATKQILRIVYTCLCESILSYCITTWGGAGGTNMMEVERAQRAVLKVMLKKPYRYPTDEIYTETGVLRVRQLYIKKVTLAMHRSALVKTTTGSPRRRPPCAVQSRVKTAFAQRLPDFRFPFIYNRMAKLCKINGKTVKECKTIIQEYLSSLTHTETEDILKIVQ